jgi:hypothetical protein
MRGLFFGLEPTERRHREKRQILNQCSKLTESKLAANAFCFSYIDSIFAFVGTETDFPDTCVFFP